MDTIDKIARLQMERAVAVAALNELDNKLRDIKAKLANAQNLQHQNRLDMEHRLTTRKRFDQQSSLTFLNAQIRSLNAQLQRELKNSADVRRAEV